MKVRYIVETYGGNPREVYRADTEAQCLQWIVGQMNEVERLRIARLEERRGFTAGEMRAHFAVREFTIRTVYTNEE